MRWAKTDYVNSVIELGKASGMEGGEVSGKEFMQALQDSTLSETEKIDAIKSFLGEELTSKHKMAEIGKILGIDLISGVDWGIQIAADDMIQSTVNAVTAAVEAAKRAADIRSPSHIMRDEVGFMLGKGAALGIDDSIPEVTIASADMANAAVSSTLGIMHAQGASSIAPYNPVLQQAYSTPQQDSAQPSAPSSNNTIPNIDLHATLMLDNGQFELAVVDAVTRANASSGGWSV